jgi:hypothetical protein
MNLDTLFACAFEQSHAEKAAGEGRRESQRKRLYEHYGRYKHKRVEAKLKYAGSLMDPARL